MQKDSSEPFDRSRVHIHAIQDRLAPSKNRYKEDRTNHNINIPPTMYDTQRYVRIQIRISKHSFQRVGQRQKERGEPVRQSSQPGQQSGQPAQIQSCAVAPITTISDPITTIISFAIVTIRFPDQENINATAAAAGAVQRYAIITYCHAMKAMCVGRSRSRVWPSSIGNSEINNQRPRPPAGVTTRRCNRCYSMLRL